MQTECMESTTSDYLVEAEAIIPDPLPYASLAPAFERGEGLPTFLASKSAAYAALHVRYTRLAEEVTSVDTKLRERVLALRQERDELRRRLGACHRVAMQRIADALDALINEQVRQRNELLAKAAAPDDRIGVLEHMQSHFGLRAMGTKRLAVAQWTPRGR